MRKVVFGFSLFLFCIVFGHNARASIEIYGFDKQHTQILFDINHLGFSNSHGAFRDYSGYFEFNRSEPEKSKVDVTIKTDSVDMGDRVWNDELKSPDFFDVQKFPDMHFVAKGIKATGPRSGTIEGDLTLLGVTKPVTLQVVFNKADKHPFTGKYVAGFSAAGIIHRSDFGMTYGTPWISNDVDIRIEVEGIRKGQGTENE